MAVQIIWNSVISARSAFSMMVVVPGAICSLLLLSILAAAVERASDAASSEIPSHSMKRNGTCIRCRYFFLRGLPSVSTIVELRRQGEAQPEER